MEEESASKNSHSGNKARETDKEEPSEMGAFAEEQESSHKSLSVSQKVEKPHKKTLV